MKNDRNSKDKMANVKLNWHVTLLMSVLLGGFGVDRFMMRKIGTGILKLVSLGGFGVWWIVDIILIATKYEFEGIKWIN